MSLQFEEVESSLVIGEESERIFKLVKDNQAMIGPRLIRDRFRLPFRWDLAMSTTFLCFMAGIALHDPIEVPYNGYLSIPTSLAFQSLEDGVVEEVPGRNQVALQPGPEKALRDEHQLGVIGV